MRKLVLVFRDPSRGLTSVEELYRNLEVEWNGQWEIHHYYYDDKKSWLQNTRFIMQLQPDIVHITSDVYCILPLLGRTRKIMTIHDIGRYNELKGIRKSAYMWIYSRLPLIFADKVIVVSDFTKNEVLGKVRFGASKKTIRIHNPVPRLFKPATKKQHDKPVLLQVGTLHNKNVERVIEALDGVHCKLKIIGRLTPQQVTLLTKHHIDFENVYGISYQEVYNYYVASDIVLFLSLNEGFGMPIIEANAVGRPVISASNTSLPEVAGKAALFVKDETSVSEIREKILMLINNTTLQTELVNAGFENIERFKLEDIAKQYLEVYQSV